MTYIIAEVGQNHNGSIEIAKKLIDSAANYFDAIKFTVRDLEAEMSCKQAASIYDNQHSFGRTYMEHREFLELSNEAILELHRYTKVTTNLDFILTLCAPSLMEKYEGLCDKIKVASRDLDNIPLLEELAKTDKEIILSTGMCIRSNEIAKAISILKKNKVSVLHCISEYPASYENLTLEAIDYLKNSFNVYKVGFSDHCRGVLASSIAVALGAQIVEKHITLNTYLKGTDHLSSLPVDKIYEFTSNIRNTEKMLYKKATSLNVSKENKKKLGRSVAYKRDLLFGDTVLKSDLHMISPGTGLKWDLVDLICNVPLTRDVHKNDLVERGDFSEK